MHSAVCNNVIDCRFYMYKKLKIQYNNEYRKKSVIALANAGTKLAFSPPHKKKNLPVGRRVAKVMFALRIYSPSTPGKRAFRSSMGVCEPCALQRSDEIGFLSATQKEKPPCWEACSESDVRFANILTIYAWKASFPIFDGSMRTLRLTAQ